MPNQLTLLPPAACSGLVRSVVSGENMGPACAATWVAAARLVVNAYGPTKVTNNCTFTVLHVFPHLI